MAGSTSSSDTAATVTAASEQALLPTTVDPAKLKEEQAGTGFPHEFRCESGSASFHFAA
jgi:hypothetical protein